MRPLWIPCPALDTLRNNDSKEDSCTKRNVYLQKQIEIIVKKQENQSTFIIEPSQQRITCMRVETRASERNLIHIAKRETRKYCATHDFLGLSRFSGEGIGSYSRRARKTQIRSALTSDWKSRPPATLMVMSTKSSDILCCARLDISCNHADGSQHSHGCSGNSNLNCWRGCFC